MSDMTNQTILQQQKIPTSGTRPHDHGTKSHAYACKSETLRSLHSHALLIRGKMQIQKVNLCIALTKVGL